MKFKNRRRFRIIKVYCIGWTAALIFLSIVRGIGTVEVGQVNMDFLPSLLFVLAIGPAFGALSGYVQILTEEYVYKRMSIQKLLFIKLTYIILFLVALVSVSYVISILFFDITADLIQFSFDDGSFPVYFYIISVELLMTIFSQVNLMLGPGKLAQLLRGKFYTPKEEERIFMFLDLQSSTQLAEKLGHIKYSMLIQDCFNDLGVVVENEAEIYQYVGDEVVLTWKLEEGLRNQNCLNAFFNFKKQLSNKQAYYLNRYECKPFFKAGVNAGVVTVTEVGKYKKEIAYHGDTINTAARIQDKCNEFKQEILISGYVKNRLGNSLYKFSKLGSIGLKGKKEEVFLYAAVENG
jgi:adenylate cyclase